MYVWINLLSKALYVNSKPDMMIKKNIKGGFVVSQKITGCATTRGETGNKTTPGETPGLTTNPQQEGWGQSNIQ